MKIEMISDIHDQFEQKEWVKRFAEEKERLEIIFDELIIKFHHIGSTAIEDCNSKSVIDILGVTNDISVISTKNSLLTQAGYTSLKEHEMQGHCYFHKENVHLHIFEDSDPEASRYLRFAFYLNAHPEKVKEYSDLKSGLVDKCSHSLETFINEVDKKAVQERTAPLHYPPLGPRKSMWAKEEIIDALHINMHAFMIYFCRYISTQFIFYQPDVTLIASKVPDDNFNTVLTTRFTEKNAKERISFVLNFYREQNLPFAWWTSLAQDTPSNLHQLLQEAGLQLKEDDIGMSLDFAHYTPVDSVHDVRRAVSHEDIADFVHILTQIGITERAYSDIYAHVPTFLFEEGAPFEMYVLYDRKGQPVTTGVVFFHLGVAGIYYIFTVPKARKKGLATAMMHHLLKRALEKGYTRSTLAATSEGKNLYKRLGFQPCCRFIEYGCSFASNLE
ncbi:MAG: GNAT family N-acetyltransferase [Chlamydiia bacterium]|nr:GNAT family N-acetyltransferase [Chlamydiia bacterium]